MRKLQVEEIMQPNKKHPCLLNRSAFNVTKFTKYTISQGTALWLRKGKVPPQN
jgi:hypothetical protein